MHLTLKKNNFLLRLISTLVLFPLGVFILCKSGHYTDVLLAIVTVLSLHEWIRLCLHSSMYALKKLVWLTSGTLYIFYACYLFWTFNADMQIYFSVLVCLTDIGGYIVGRWLKGPKLAVKISPNKTWSGALGGVILTAVVLLGIRYFFGEAGQKHSPKEFIYTSGIVIFLSSMAQAGDLLQSWCKRQFGVKDSGKLIPGHGGILDRLDGFFAVSLAAGLILYILKQPFYKYIYILNS
ncbi:MAG: phosphatidate cytidylyltransferase [Alphaproteobacteria bacterium]|nr:phosphatidate cytidylyltransferase [Alphaproteobacteria bacterium]